MFNYPRSQSEADMARLVEAYARTLTKLTHDAELFYPYAKQTGQSQQEHEQELKQHLAGLTLVIGAALAELSTLSQVAPVALETLSELLPKENINPNPKSLSQSDLLEKVAQRIGRFQILLNAVDPNPAKMTQTKISIKHEIDVCNGLMNDLKASPEWQHVKGLASVKLLSDVLEHGVELSAKQGQRPKP